MGLFLFKQVDDAHGDFRWAEVIAPVVVDALAAGLAIEFIVIHIQVAQTDLGADIHPVAHNPLVTVGETAAVKVALVAVVLHGTEREVAEVVAARHAVDAEEVAFERFAQPVTVFRLNQPVLHLTVVLESKWIVIATDSDTHILMEAEFKSKVRGGRQPIQSVGVYRPLLGIGFRCIYK